jgi:hypothetical protein
LTETAAAMTERKLNRLYDKFEKDPKLETLLRMAEIKGDNLDADFTLSECFRWSLPKIPPAELARIIARSNDLDDLFVERSCRGCICEWWFDALTPEQREAVKPHVDPNLVLEYASMPHQKDFEVVDLIALTNDATRE